MKTKSKITKEELIAFGMKENTGDTSFVFPMEKVISIPKTDKEKKDSGLDDMAICITQMRNVPELCLMLPDGGCLYLGCETIEDLKTFEKCILEFEPNY